MLRLKAIKHMGRETMKSIEAALILPIILLLFFLTASSCLVVYAQSSKFNAQYLKTSLSTKQASKMLNYDIKQMHLAGLKAKALGERNVKLISFNCRANQILDLVYFVKDELSER